MNDTVYAAILVLFCLLTWGFVALCGKLMEVKR